MNLYKSIGEINGKKRVFIAVPVIGGVCSGTVASLFGAKEELAKAGIESELCIFSGNCHVDDSRNRLVREFLESKADELVFIDADVRFDPLDLVSLVGYDRDVVAGVYPLKNDDEKYPVKYKDGEIWSDKDGLIEVEAAPTGFMKIKREVFESFDVPGFYSKTCKPTQRKIPIIFERTLRENTRLGGDYEFCRKWADKGGKIYISPEFYFGHIGSKEYEGSIGHYLREYNGLTDDFIKEKLDKIYKNNYTIQDIAELARSWGNAWTIPIDEIMTICKLAEKTAGPVLECGSGLTSLILGAIGSRKGFCVVSLEHDEAWLKRVKMFSFSKNKLVKSEIKSGFYSDIPDHKYSMVFLDGPPRKISKRNKFKDHLNLMGDNCVVVVDDIDTYPDILDIFDFEFLEFGRYAVGEKK